MSLIIISSLAYHINHISIIEHQNKKGCKSSPAPTCSDLVREDFLNIKDVRSGADRLWDKKSCDAKNSRLVGGGTQHWKLRGAFNSKSLAKLSNWPPVPLPGGWDEKIGWDSWALRTFSTGCKEWDSVGPLPPGWDRIPSFFSPKIPDWRLP